MDLNGRQVKIDTELAAVRRGHECGMVTDEELYRRLGELERLLWTGVLRRAREVVPAERPRARYA